MYPFKSVKTTESNNDTQQWPLNQAAYQNVANDQVDWAALAQQWIYMKENFPTDDMPAAPPPPNISKHDFEEKGEAPMEVEKEDEPTNETATYQQTTCIADNNKLMPETQHWQQTGWNNMQPQWRKKRGWNTWTNPNIAQTSQAITQPIRQPLLPDPYSTSLPDIIDNRTDGYWSSNEDRFNNKIYSILPEQSNQEDISSKVMSNNLNMSELPSALDAAKRKTLPAWIRQGLEKMEREKQKSAEKEREIQERTALLEQRKKFEQELTSLPKDLPLRSKFDSESDSDDDRIHMAPEASRSTSPAVTKVQSKSKPEQLHEVMLLVRETLTEILLQVTNEEIRSIALDTLSKSRSKARTAQSVRKTALSCLTGGLGLGIYADSDDNSRDSGSDISEDANTPAEIDSDLELQETIKRRKASFESKSKEIEAAIATEAEKEKRWLHTENESKESLSKRTAIDSDKEIGEIQHENILLTHGRRKEKKTSRFSDPMDTVKNIHVTHGSIVYETNSPVKIENTTSLLHSSSNLDSKDSDSSSTSTKLKHVRSKKSNKNNTSSDDSDNDKEYYNQRMEYENHRKSRSSSSEKKHRSYNYKKSSERKSYYYADKQSSQYRDRQRSTSSSRDKTTKNYDSFSYKNSYSRKRSRSPSQSKVRKYSHHRN